MSDIHFFSVERTMKHLPSSVVCALALASFGCHPDAVSNPPVLPVAAINWINLVPDTGQLDMRVVDIVDNAGLFDASFRGSKPFPEAITAGTRRIRVFISSLDPGGNILVVDTTYSFVANEQYGFFMGGFLRTGQTPAARPVIATGAPPTPGAGKIAIRVINLAPSFAGAIPTLADTTVHPDVFVRKAIDMPGGPAEVVNMGFAGVSPYMVMDTGLYRVELTATGTTNPAIVQSPVPGGTPGTSTVNPIAGSLVAGTVLTAIIVPRSVVGSLAPQGGQPAARATDTTTAEASRRVSRSNDTVTVQSGSVTIVTNRSIPRPPPLPDSTPPDTTLTSRGTGTKASTGVAAGNVVYVSGATQPEYNGWQVVMAVADSLSCNPTDPADTPAKCAAKNDTATTRFRFRYRIVGTPISPATGTTVYRIYAPDYRATAADFNIPYVMFLVDKRPPNTTP